MRSGHGVVMRLALEYQTDIGKSAGVASVLAPTLSVQRRADRMSLF